jgi:hypothetical protein
VEVSNYTKAVTIEVALEEANITELCDDTYIVCPIHRVAILLANEFFLGALDMLNIT